MKPITVREFATLSTRPGVNSLDFAQISKSAFEWLLEQSQNDELHFRKMIRLKTPTSLKVKNYVGVIETPCGVSIEVLPKHSHHLTDAKSARTLLIDMISKALKLTPANLGEASITAFDVPVTEWLMDRFVQAIAKLAAGGMRRDYERVSSAERYIRGRLNVVRQLRAGPARAHHFEIDYDEFTFNTAENRIVKTALTKCLRLTRVGSTWRLANELCHLLAEVPETVDLRRDFHRWTDHRLSNAYADVRPLAELIVADRSPVAVAGSQRGLSLLFPMERLFEQYVLGALQSLLPKGFEVRSQLKEHYLCQHGNDGYFGLKPDFVVVGNETSWVIDAKWKLLTQKADGVSGISEADFYQMLAYSRKYLSAGGDLFLAYPRTETFREVVGPFELDASTRIHLVPFDLSEQKLPSLDSWLLKGALSRHFDDPRGCQPSSGR